MKLRVLMNETYPMRYGAIMGMRKVFIVWLLCLCAAWPASAERALRIAGFGDSLVHGYGLSPDDGFAPQMGRWLQAQGVDVEMINAGVSGETTAGGAARIDWTLSDKPDAMIVVLGGNDMLRGIDPKEVYSNLDAIITKARGAGVEVLLVGMRAPLNYGPDYKAEFDQAYPTLAMERDTEYYPSFFQALAKFSDDPAKLREVMQADGIHPNANGVALVVEDMGPSVLRLIARVTEP